MSYRVPEFSNKQIEEMDDNQLYQECRNLKRLIQKMRKDGFDTRTAEEEFSYLQAEAQNRGLNF